MASGLDIGGTLVGAAIPPTEAYAHAVSDVDDVASILAVDNRDFGRVSHATPLAGDSTFTWQYERTRDGLTKLYERAKTAQWNATTDLDWSINVDIEAVANDAGPGLGPVAQALAQADNSPIRKWGDAEWTQFRIEVMNWRLSQFLHGEQGALVCASKIVDTTPWIEAKYFASTQVVDEARHVEVFSRYLNEKLGGFYEVNGHLQLLIDDLLSDTRWDITYMGMQILVEGLALAAFGYIHSVTTEPLLKQLLRYVLADEARHVAFGVISLQEFYEGLTAAEIRERQEFAYEACVLLRNRFMMHAVWERMGVDKQFVTEFLLTLRKPGMNPFANALFSKVVPNCKKLGLIDAGDGWLRDRFAEIGVLEFEDLADTATELELAAAE